MFDFAWSELGLIAAISVLVLGPKQLPETMRSIAKVMKRVRNIGAEFQDHINDMLKEAELDEVRQTVRKLSSTNVSGEISKYLDPQDEVKAAVGEVKTAVGEVETAMTNLDAPTPPPTPAEESAIAAPAPAEAAAEPAPAETPASETTAAPASETAETPPPEEEKAPSTAVAAAPARVVQDWGPHG